MAYSRDYVKSFARNAGLTNDHDLYTRTLMADLSSMPVLEVSKHDFNSIDQSAPSEKFKIQPAVLPYMKSICCIEPQLERCYNELEKRQLSKLELPLLRTDPDNDLHEFKKKMRCQQGEYSGMIKSLDLSCLDQILLDVPTAAVTDARHDQKAMRFSCLVPRAAKDLLKSILRVENVLGAECSPPSVVLASDPCHIEHPMTPLRKIEQLPLTDCFSIPSSSLTIIDDQITNSPPTSIERRTHLPGDTKGLPYIVEPLEDHVARISVSPEIETFCVKPKQSRLGSPLTPPNSIRPHRKMQDKNSKKSVQSNGHRNMSILQEGQPANQDSTILGKLHPRKTLQKIKLEELTQTQAPSLKSHILDHDVQTSFIQDIQKALEEHRLPSVDVHDYDWAPWTPFRFDEEAFHSRFDVLPNGKPLAPLEIPRPIDPRILLDSIDTDEAFTDELKPIKLTRPWNSILIPKKRSLDANCYAVDCRGDASSNSDKAHRFEMFETSFPSMAFELLANGSNHLKKPRITIDARPAPLNSQFDEQAQNILPQASTLRLESSPRPVSSSKVFQIIVTSCDVLTRQVVRSIHRAFPEIKIVERDFMAGLTSKDSIPSDADILYSPKSGIIFTTIEEVQQQALPGSNIVPKFRRKVAALAIKFESIYVLVKVRQGIDPYILCETRNFLEQEGQASDTVIQMEVFKENQTVTLNHRVADLVRQEHIQLPDLHLTEEENYWEVFLRKKMAINTYAAQIIVQKSLIAAINGQEESLSLLKYLNKENCLKELSVILGKKTSELLRIGLSRFEEARVDALINARSMYG